MNAIYFYSLINKQYGQLRCLQPGSHAPVTDVAHPLTAANTHPPRVLSPPPPKSVTRTPEKNSVVLSELSFTVNRNIWILSQLTTSSWCFLLLCNCPSYLYVAFFSSSCCLDCGETAFHSTFSLLYHWKTSVLCHHLHHHHHHQHLTPLSMSPVSGQEWQTSQKAW